METKETRLDAKDVYKVKIDGGLVAFFMKQVPWGTRNKVKSLAMDATEYEIKSDGSYEVTGFDPLKLSNVIIEITSMLLVKIKRDGVEFDTSAASLMEHISEDEGGQLEEFVNEKYGDLVIGNSQEVETKKKVKS